MDLSCFNRERPVTHDPERSGFTKGFLACCLTASAPEAAVCSTCSVPPCSSNNLGQSPGGRLEDAIRKCGYIQVELLADLIMSLAGLLRAVPLWLFDLPHGSKPRFG